VMALLAVTALLVGVAATTVKEPELTSLYELGDVPLTPLNPRHSGPRLKMSNFNGKVLLVSNVASGCTYTDNSYAQLNELHKRFQSRGLQVIGVPSDSFNQEPGADDAIYDFAVRGKGIKFTMLSKTEVNGADSHPLYKWLKGEYIESLCDDRDLQCGGWAEAGECDKNPNYMLKNCKKSCTKCSEAYPFGGPIKWNFDHFLVSRTGNVIARWEGAADLLAAQQIAAIEHALKQKTPAGKKARDLAPWYIAVPFVLITVLLIAFIIRTRKDPIEEAVPAPAPPATKKKDDKPGGSKKKQ